MSLFVVPVLDIVFETKSDRFVRKDRKSDQPKQNKSEEKVSAVASQKLVSI